MQKIVSDADIETPSGVLPHWIRARTHVETPGFIIIIIVIISIGECSIGAAARCASGPTGAYMPLDSPDRGIRPDLLGPAPAGSGPGRIEESDADQTGNLNE